jgi:ADP-heptose:LPS heptosyltransferase
VFRELGFSIDLSDPEFPKTAELTSEVKSITGEKAGKWIGIAPFAKHRGKQYPQDLMSEVVSGLAKNQDHKLFLFGAGADETQILESLSSHNENAIVVVGKLKLKQELELISKLDVMLSMDSGNAHIAAMFGIPTVTLWGATHPYAGFAPFHQPESNAVVSDRQKFPLLPTSVYGNKIVPGYEDAMRTISADSVVEKIEKIVSK